jgi:hypothetical protein
MKGSILFNPNKAGTIILSHYRSGGTQMRRFINGICTSTKIPFTDCGEFDLNLDEESLQEQASKYFEPTDKYKIIQLNNPQSISFLLSTGLLDSIVQNYNIFRVKRNDKKRTLLSLPVWEKLIEQKLFSQPFGYTPEMMDDFGCLLENNTLSPESIHLGLNLELRFKNPTRYLNTILWIFTQSLETLNSIEQRYSIPSIVYEQYEEYSEQFYEEYLMQYEVKPQDEDAEPKLKTWYRDTYLGKIPYIVDDFEVYFQESVQKAIKEWKI